MTTSRFLITAVATLCLGGANAEQFTVVHIPDTQHYTGEREGGTWEMFDDMMAWCVAQKDNLNIVFVGHIGDIEIQNHYTDARVLRTRNTFAILENAGIPYAIGLGNHDGCENIGSNPNSTSKYNRFFPLADFENLPSFGGYFDTDQAGPMDNTYHFFRGGGVDWMVLAVEYGPHDETMVWIENTLKNHPNHKVIMLYHGWLDNDNEIANQATENYGRDNNAQDIWKIAKEYANVFMVLSGHTWDVGRRVEAGDNGNTVYMLMADYCETVTGTGGGGFLRVITFDSSEDKFSVRSYSPYLSEYKTDSENEFEYTNLGIFSSVSTIPSKGTAAQDAEQSRGTFDAAGRKLAGQSAGTTGTSRAPSRSFPRP